MLSTVKFAYFEFGGNILKYTTLRVFNFQFQALSSCFYIFKSVLGFALAVYHFRNSSFSFQPFITSLANGSCLLHNHNYEITDSDSSQLSTFVGSNFIKSRSWIMDIGSGMRSKTFTNLPVD